MKKQLLILLVLYLGIIYATAQPKYDKNWVIGYGQKTSKDTINGALLTFNNKELIVNPIRKDLWMDATSTTISNKNGQLLFYSNGCRINNPNHKLITNGDSIGKGILERSYCTGVSASVPTSQAIFAVPNLSDTSLYYLLNLDLDSYYTNESGKFPLVPAKLFLNTLKVENGATKVVEKVKLVLQDTFARGGLHGIRHRNRKDWWVVIPKSNSNCYWVGLLTDKGNFSLKKQCMGTFWDDNDVNTQSAFSPNGKYYARIGQSKFLYVYQFDDNNGTMTFLYEHEFAAEPTTPGVAFYDAGVAFAPNSKYLYAMCDQHLFQFDMSSLSFESSKVLIAKAEPSIKSKFSSEFCNARLAPDGKIYIAGFATHDYLHVIHKPNEKGSTCELEQYGVILPCYNHYGLPNLPYFSDWDREVISTEPALLNDNIAIKVFPNSFVAQFHIELAAYQQPLQFELYDSAGRLRITQPIRDTFTSVDSENLANSIYFYCIRDETQRVVKSGKLLKY